MRYQREGQESQDHARLGLDMRLSATATAHAWRIVGDRGRHTSVTRWGSGGGRARAAFVTQSTEVRSTAGSTLNLAENG